MDYLVNEGNSTNNEEWNRIGEICAQKHSNDRVVSADALNIHLGRGGEDFAVLETSTREGELGERVLGGLKRVGCRKHVYFHGLSDRGGHDRDVRVDEGCVGVRLALYRGFRICFGLQGEFDGDNGRLVVMG